MLTLLNYYQRHVAELGWDARVALSVYGSFSSKEYIKAQKLRLVMSHYLVFLINGTKFIKSLMTTNSILECYMVLLNYDQESAGKVSQENIC